MIWEQSMQSTILSVLLSQTSTVDVPALLRYTYLSTAIRDTHASLHKACCCLGGRRHTNTRRLLFLQTDSSLCRHVNLKLRCVPVNKLTHISLRDSLRDEVRSRVNGPADVVVGAEGEDLGPAAGPHTPAVLWVHRLPQTHDRSVDVSHLDSFNRLSIFLLPGGEQKEFRLCKYENKNQNSAIFDIW